MTGRCLLISAAIVLFTTSCGGEAIPTAPTQAVSARATWLTVTLTLIANSLALTGNEHQAKAVADFSDRSRADVTAEASWTTSDSSVATVSQTGRVTVVGVGTVSIIATYQGLTGQSSLTISVGASQIVGRHGVRGRPNSIQAWSLG